MMYNTTKTRVFIVYMNINTYERNNTSITLSTRMHAWISNCYRCYARLRHQHRHRHHRSTIIIIGHDSIVCVLLHMVCVREHQSRSSVVPRSNDTNAWRQFLSFTLVSACLLRANETTFTFRRERRTIVLAAGAPAGCCANPQARANIRQPLVRVSRDTRDTREGNVVV